MEGRHEPKRVRPMAKSLIINAKRARTGAAQRPFFQPSAVKAEAEESGWGSSSHEALETEQQDEWSQQDASQHQEDWQQQDEWADQDGRQAEEWNEESYQPASSSWKPPGLRGSAAAGWQKKVGMMQAAMHEAMQEEGWQKKFMQSAMQAGWRPAGGGAQQVRPPPPGLRPRGLQFGGVAAQRQQFHTPGAQFDGGWQQPHSPAGWEQQQQQQQDWQQPQRQGDWNQQQRPGSWQQGAGDWQQAHGQEQPNNSAWQQPQVQEEPDDADLPPRLEAAEVEQGMVVLYWDGHEGVFRRGWVENCFTDMNEFWVRAEITNELVTQGDSDIRAFSAGEMRSTGEWSHDAVVTKSVEVPDIPSLRNFLRSTDGDLRIQKLMDSTGEPLQFEEVPADAGTGQAATCCIVVGPGFPPDVKAAAGVVEEAVQELVSDHAPEQSERWPKQLQKPSWVAEDGRDNVDKKSKVKEERGQQKVKKEEDEESEYRKGFEAYMAQVAAEAEKDMGAMTQAIVEEARQAALGKSAMMPAEEKTKQEPEETEGTTAKAETDIPKASTATSEKSSDAWTVQDWLKNQQEFSHLPALQPGWIRIKSKKGQTYCLNVETGKTAATAPLAEAAALPDGWTQVTSKSSGKSYYWNAKLAKSQYDRPKE